MENSLISIGEKLRKSREGRSLTIDQVQKNTRIHAHVLKSLEDGTCGTELSATYVKSFLRKYCDYLGLNANEIIKQYSSTLPEKIVEVQPVVNKIQIKTGETEQSPSDIVPKLIVAGVSALVLIAVIFFISLIGRMATSSFNKSRSPSKAIEASATPKAARRKKVVTSKESTSKYLGNKGMLIYLVLKTKQNVHIILSKDGVSQFDRIVPKGTVEAIKASEKIELYIAKAEAVELVLNGKALGSPGRGLIKNLEITTKGMEIK